MDKLGLAIGLTLMFVGFFGQIAFISHNVHELQNSVLEIKKILTTENFEYNNCYETEELNLIICKKGEK